MPYSDSIHKIIGYIDAANSETLTVSDKFFRDYTCPSGCGGCCAKFSLDYFEGPRWEKFKKLYPQHVHRFEKREVNGATVFTDFQKDNNGFRCRHLRQEDGRCNIHESNPFSCEFELMRFNKSARSASITNRLFSRGWNMKRTDGGRGAKCEMLPYSSEKNERDIAMLKELHTYAKRLGLPSKLPRLVRAVEKIKIQYDKGLRLKKSFKV